MSFGRMSIPCRLCLEVVVIVPSAEGPESAPPRLQAPAPDCERPGLR